MDDIEGKEEERDLWHEETESHRTHEEMLEEKGRDVPSNE